MIDARFANITEENRRLAQQVEDLSQETKALQKNLSEAMSAVLLLRADNLIDKLIERSQNLPDPKSANLIVSVASYNLRINAIAPMIRSIGQQTVKPDCSFLWLPKEDFPQGVKDLPASVICALYDAGFYVRFTDENLGPHNKYYWTMSEYPESLVLTLDDDVVYPSKLIERYIKANKRWPDAVIGMRTHLITTEHGNIAPYASWKHVQDEIIDVPSHRIMLTGVSGALYPKHSLDVHCFDINGIRNCCLYADDLWLKIMELAADTKVVCPSDGFKLNYIEDTQDVALYKMNLDQGKNDIQLRNILNYVSSFFSLDELLNKLQD